MSDEPVEHTHIHHWIGGDRSFTHAHPMPYSVGRNETWAHTNWRHSHMNGQHAHPHGHSEYQPNDGDDDTPLRDQHLP